MCRQVTLEEATAKSTQLGLMFMETSAKAGHNVKGLFKKIAISLPGMEKDVHGDANTSKSFCHRYNPCSSTDNYTSEIDVTTPSASELPDASACNC